MRTFWLQPEPPYNLGVCRCLWYGWLFLIYWGEDFSAWGHVDPVFWHPIPLFRIAGCAPPDQSTVAILQALWKASLAGCCVGLFTRTHAVVACVLGFYLLGLPNNFGKVNHDTPVVVLTLFILAWSRCGDAFSLDRLLRRQPIVSSGEYRWPIRAVWMLLSLIFFAAGTAKLRASGLAWMDGEYLSLLLAQNRSVAWTEWGFHLAQSPWACVGLSVATVAIECGLGLAVLHPYLRAVLVPAAVVMLLAFPLLIGPFFQPLLATFVFWIPWTSLVPIGREARSAGAA